ncbi:hypothetical protein Q757_06320 [Oenococcus alcoholitolerans]|uniref:Uncharacterized protein n=1 Tax=Oenococcus alcoholitolerans TaxID=931074 RepID=A0ABR4XQ39_9LACO|nr:hypothetical protein Q757_06320 [Oenococcus alcoholitolerans]
MVMPKVPVGNKTYRIGQVNTVDIQSVLAT